MTTLYGLKNCDRCREARRWLTAAGIEHRFVDLRESPPERATLDAWLASVGAASLVNRRSTTWRALPADTREHDVEKRPAQLLLAHPTLIKRPVLSHGESILVGFDESR